jgi:hypothetical protein
VLYPKTGLFATGVSVAAREKGLTAPFAFHVPGEDIGASARMQRSEQRQYYVEPAALTTLRRGGPANDNQMAVIVYAGGKLFRGEGSESLLTRC